MTRLCTICARGGSKGVPGKNTRLLAGLPMLVHSIKQAQASGLFDVVAVSSESQPILGIAGEYKAFLIHRPDRMATDTASKLPAMGHAIRDVEVRLNIKVDTYVDLDCTSPLRSLDDIRSVVMMLETRKVTNVVTGCPARRHPGFNMVRKSKDGTHVGLVTPSSVHRRQDAPPCWDMNASIYAWDRKSILESPVLWNDDTLLYEMPVERSWDIDTELDFKIVRMLMEQKHGTPRQTPKS